MIRAGEHKVAILGYSCSGKTTLCHKLAKQFPDFHIYHTDEYQGITDYNGAPHAVMSDILRDSKRSIIVEGIHAYRILRAGIESNKLYFDLIIVCHTDEEERQMRYRSERDPEKLDRNLANNKALDKIYRDYESMAEQEGHFPRVAHYNSTSFVWQKG
jgi:uridine kinase